MKECDNSTRKIHTSSNFILSISLLIMFDTILLRPSLHCNTPLHFTTLHPTTLLLHFTQLHFTSTLHFLSFTLYYPYLHFTPSHLHFTTLSFNFTHLHFLPFYFTSHHYTRHSTVLISKHISKIMNPFTALKNFSPFHFTFYFIFYLFTCPINPTLHFTFLFLNITNFPSLHFSSLFIAFTSPHCFSLS
jgi:hypothetical protein